LAIVEEFVAWLGWEVDDEELKDFEKDLQDLDQIVKGVAGAVAVATAAVTGFLVVQNQQTAQTQALANAYGVTAEFLEAMGGAVKGLGFDVENVGDIIEEMNNKIGESKGLAKPMSAVADATKILGLNWKEIKDLDPGAQLIEILDAAIKLEDQQKAVAAVDILAGAEANRIVGFLRSQDESLRDIIARQFQLNQLTEEGRKGAVMWTAALGEMTTVGGSLLQQFAGLVGEGLTPLITELTNLVIENKEVVKVGLAKWADLVVDAFKRLFSIGKWVFDRIHGLVELFGGLEQVLRIASILFATFVTQKTLRVLQSAVTLVTGLVAQMTRAQAISKLKVVADAAGLGVAVALFDDLLAYFEGRDSLTGRMAEAWTGAFEVMMDAVFDFVAELTGIPVDELKLKWVQLLTEPLTQISKVFDLAIEKIEDLFGADFAGWARSLLHWFGIPFYFLAKLASGTFDLIVGLFMGDLDERFSMWSKGVIEYFEQMVNPIVGVFTQIKDTVVDAFGSIVQTINKAIDALPAPLRSVLRGGLSVVGNLLPSVRETVATAAFSPTEGFQAAAESAAALTPTQRALSVPTLAPSFITGAGQAARPPLVQVTNQPNYQITQQPGEDGEALATRIDDKFQESAAQVARNLASGVQY
jgi:hypothetical protein